MELTSVKMQSVVIDKEYFDEWYMPLLRFGRGKKNEFKMNLYIKGENKEKVTQCYNELIAFKGKDIEEIRLRHDEIVVKYNEWKPKN